MLSAVQLCRAVCTHPSAVVTQFPVLQPTRLDEFATCSVFNFSTKSVVNLLRIQYTPPTRLNSTVESRRRCVLARSCFTILEVTVNCRRGCNYHVCWEIRGGANRSATVTFFLPARRYAYRGLCDSNLSVRPSVTAGIMSSTAKARS